MTTPTAQQIDEAKATLDALRRRLAQTLVGQAPLVDGLLIALLTGSSLLIEGVPGLAKTLAARTLAEAAGLDFKRVQFTPDLLPSDILGAEIFHPPTGEFRLRKGPIFTQILLADEINRAPPKVQSALLEAMQEHRVTLGLETLPLPAPFFVLATQNPVEQEGAYPLPEAQLDRFLLKVVVDYPSESQERSIVDRFARGIQDTTNAIGMGPVTGLGQAGVLALGRLTDAVHLEDKIRDYIVTLARATRAPSAYRLPWAGPLTLGASPRASLALATASKAYALLQGRTFVVPDDVKSVGRDVFRHRLLLSFEAEADAVTVDRLLDQLFATIPTP